MIKIKKKLKKTIDKQIIKWYNYYRKVKKTPLFKNGLGGSPKYHPKIFQHLLDKKNKKKYWQII